MMSRLAQGYTAIAIAAVAGISTVTLAGPEWVELGDAGSRPPNAQPIGGSGTLTRISGELAGPGVGTGDFQDMYLFRIVAPTTFTATTLESAGGSSEFNPSLWLFKVDGTGLQGNIDTDVSSLGVDPAASLAYQATDPQGTVIPEPGLYLICIGSQYDRPFSEPKSGPEEIFDFQSNTERSSPDGPGGAYPIIEWQNIGNSQDGLTGAYVIVLTSAAMINESVTLNLDIKPGGCPNSFNRGSNGVLPASILGTAGFDVHDINISTVVISRADGIGGSQHTHEGPPGPHSVYEDNATPFVGPECGCHELGADGFLDLSVKFKSSEMVEALQLNSLPSGALVRMKVSGELNDGTDFESFDCLRLVPPAAPPGLIDVSATVAGTWIGMGSLDLRLDGGGFANFQRTYPQTTVVTLTAQPVSKFQFQGWRINGSQQLQSGLTLTYTVGSATQSIEAVYQPSLSSSR